MTDPHLAIPSHPAAGEANHVICLSHPAAGGQWKAAQEVFEQMLPCGCKPDSMTYGILISAYDKGNQWCLALQVSKIDPTQ